MNCENCKNKTATVFYADDGGGRHSLCAACAQTLGKVSGYSPRESEQKSASPFFPTLTLSALVSPEPSMPLLSMNVEGDTRVICPYCATALEGVLANRRAGCPECYTVFAAYLFPSALTPETAKGARMPSSYRSAIDRIRSVSELRSQIKLAIETEDFELAAALRDKIRKLEGPHRT